MNFPWQTGRFDPRAGGKARVGGEEGKEAKPERVALVLGVTGIVGNSLAELLVSPDAPGGPWKVYGVARRPKPEWLSQPRLEYVQCDLLDLNQTKAKLAPLRDVTHVFYVTWVNRETEAENCRVNGDMFRNVLDTVVANAEPLEHIVLQTGGKHYVGPFSSPSWANEPPFREDMPRLPGENFYYNQEDILFETVKRKEGLTWSVHRPGEIFGFAAGNLMNIVGTLAVYATICKHEGMPLVFPGNEFAWEHFSDQSDAGLIAEQELWACLDPRAKNEAFNIPAGDVFKYKRLWHLLAERYGLEVPPFRVGAPSLEEMMRDKDPVWEKIVRENSLVPTKLADVGHWWFVDIVLNKPLEIVYSPNKMREHGFLGFRNSEKSFLSVIDKMKKHNVIP